MDNEGGEMKIKYFGLQKFDDDSAVSRITIKFDDKTTLKKAWDYYFSDIEKRCYCEYDCCGHVFSSPKNVIRKGNNKFEYSISYARNY